MHHKDTTRYVFIVAAHKRLLSYISFRSDKFDNGDKSAAEKVFNRRKVSAADRLKSSEDTVRYVMEEKQWVENGGVDGRK